MLYFKSNFTKQTNWNLFIIDYCRRCSLASSKVRCLDVVEFHNRWMQLWVLSELHYKYKDNVNGILMLHGMISKSHIGYWLCGLLLLPGCLHPTHDTRTYLHTGWFGSTQHTWLQFPFGGRGVSRTLYFMHFAGLTQHINAPRWQIGPLGDRGLPTTSKKKIIKVWITFNTTFGLNQ